VPSALIACRYSLPLAIHVTPVADANDDHSLYNVIHPRHKLVTPAGIVQRWPEACRHPPEAGSKDAWGFQEYSRDVECLDVISTLYTRKSLIQKAERVTLSYMKTSTLTIRMDDELSALLDTVTKRSGRTRSEIAREALRRQLRVTRFDNLRKRVMPFAEARGYLTDDDVFAAVS
jgi:predicted transcriptional regulator